ncbi:MAG: hypothetical protein DMG58_22665 [Acidobacteria bacterium]|nr:MAG: hypothetical protein DMG58_22665 [Acidobacteriota bacterium]
MLAVHQRQLVQLQSQPRNTLDASGLLRFRHTAGYRLPALCHNDSVHNDRFHESRGKRIARLVAVRR